MSSSSSTSPTTVNGVTRFSGLSSGVDVDSLVQKLISADSGTLNKLKQTNQIDKWKQEQYRTIISDITAFSDKYLNLASSDSILRQSSFQQFKVTSDNSAVSAIANGDAVKGTHTLSVSQLATAATQASNSGVTKDVSGSGMPDYDSLKGKSFTIKVDGTVRTVTFDSAYDSSAQTGVQYVQAAMNKAIGTANDSSGTTINKITVSEDSGCLKFVPTANSGVGSITVNNASAKGAFSALGFNAGSNLSNRLSMSDTLATVAGKLKSPFAFDSSSGEIEFTINGKKFSFDKSEALGDMIDTINRDTDANVTMKYDQNFDQLVITANSTGAGKTLSIADTSGTFVSRVLTIPTEGKDAQVVLDRQRLTRSSNSFTQDGVTYTANKVTSDAASVNIAQDVDGIYTKISNFITGYNTLIKEVNDKISESYDKNYLPLTDDQQKAMSETERTNWDKKAQTGLLERDSVLDSMVYNMRSALMSSVSGQSESLIKLGITTGKYTEKGKLYIDEDKLRKAISNDPQGVMNFFIQQSTTYPGTITVRTLNSSERNTRTREEGLAYKLYDILQDNIGTVRDSNGTKGLLIEKAGTTGDASETTNGLTKEMNTLADKITAEQKRINNEENRYYTQFTNMETALEKLSSQSSFLSSFASS
ncbi:flagellar hook-associated protein 2 [Sporomusaceae bacterium BoRhaA]|uniref:flagellar filament capping protein FliD n=1 Tax=Pelorhabdus rhamnosifermentans TaxID=2772457 RepID=UPI001C05F81A|nr:flagellar filament capping protein FliD [Pelorhabdus rhamnosifermentans]MBU2703571.1 flagellar hook-associated protein 2 [Pelorhabdus rhamnosifermentans]